MPLQTLETSTGVVVTENRLIAVTVATGFRAATLRSSLVVDDYHHLNSRQLSARIKEAGISAERVILGLPREQLVVRIVELPLEVEENLEQVAAFQAEKFEPVDEGEASFRDSFVLSRDDKARKLRLAIAMAPSRVLEEPLALLEEIGLSPTAVRVAGLAQSHLLHVHRDGFPVEYPALILGVEEARLSFNLTGGPQGGYSDRVLLETPPDIETVLRELNLFASQVDLSEEGISKIYLTTDRLATELQEKFEDCEPFYRGATLKLGKTRPSQLPILTDALALALSGLSRDGAFDLVPEERRAAQLRATWVPTLVLSLLLAVMVGAVLVRDLVQSRQLSEELDRRIQALSGAVEQTMAMKNRINDAKSRLVELEEKLTGNTTVLRVLRELTEKMPDTTYLDSLTIQRDRVNLGGYASPRAGTLLSRLQKAVCLTNVSSRSTHPGPNGSERFRFEAALVNCGDPQSEEASDEKVSEE